MWWVCVLLLLCAQPAWASITDYILYYKFDETSGTSANDESANNNDGALDGFSGTYWVTGHPGTGNGLQFSGDNDFVALAQQASLSPGSGDMTIACWVNFGAVDSSAHWIYNDYDAADTATVVLRLNSDNTLNFFVRNAASEVSQVSTTSTLSTGVWYHVIAIKTGNNVAIYLNNTAEGTPSNGLAGAVNVDDATRLPIVGAGIGGSVNFFNGIIDEFRIYNNAKDATDRTALYTFGSAASVARRRVWIY